LLAPGTFRHEICRSIQALQLRLLIELVSSSGKIAWHADDQSAFH